MIRRILLLTDFFRLWSLIVNIVKLSHSLRNLSSSFFFFFSFFAYFTTINDETFRSSLSYPCSTRGSNFTWKQIYILHLYEYVTVRVCTDETLVSEIKKFHRQLDTLFFIHTCVYIYTFHNLVSQLSKVLI